MTGVRAWIQYMSIMHSTVFNMHHVSCPHIMIYMLKHS